MRVRRQRAGAFMEIHKPKAAHSWREFLIEIGTIVCGILIALGLEQVIVRVEWSHRDNDLPLRANIDGELPIVRAVFQWRLDLRSW